MLADLPRVMCVHRSLIITFSNTAAVTWRIGFQLRAVMVVSFYLICNNRSVTMFAIVYFKLLMLTGKTNETSAETSTPLLPLPALPHTRQGDSNSTDYMHARPVPSPSPPLNQLLPRGTLLHRSFQTKLETKPKQISIFTANHNPP